MMISIYNERIGITLNIFFILNIISLELLVFTYLIIFGVFGVKLGKHRKGITWSSHIIAFLLSIISTICIKSVISFIIATITGLFLFVAGILLLTQKKQKSNKQDFYLAANSYTVSKTQNPYTGMNQLAYNIFIIQDKNIIRITSIEPDIHRDVILHCHLEQDVYVCDYYEYPDKAKPKLTFNGFLSSLQTITITISSILLPVFIVFAEIWKIEYGISDDNPYAQGFTSCIGLLIMGFCSKYLKGTKDLLSRLLRIFSIVLYYIMFFFSIFKIFDFIFITLK